MQLGYQFRLYPSAPQKQRLAREFGCGALAGPEDAA
ncbi:helix-turn-helix domain-containing protein [Streptomyces halobius]|uniref:Helix-turn-helix domain-containing protein n=1 Tax=Streptomyces halobius TaxID=2879846 RepID=A0ABY4MDP9_9ACTN|nr:helix-turn-helix domain-containing protein [Streptomyces halobius]